MHPFIPVLSPSFLYHPIKRFFIYLSPLFFCCTLHISSEEYSYRHFKERLPEAICFCFNVDVVLLVMYSMYIPGFIVTSAAISQLWVYLCNLLPEAIKLVMFMEHG